MEIGIKHQNANFNPRPREEGDVSPATATLSKGDFNPRPREEGEANLYNDYLYFEAKYHISDIFHQ